MLPRHGILTLAVVIVVVLLSGASRLETTVNLEWRPHRQTVEIGEIVEIALYAVSSTALDVSVTGIQAILIWDPAYLGFQGIVDPCNGGGTCPDNAYDWLTSDFPPNVLNITFDDGNAFYVAFAHFTSGAQAVATSEGLWVTTFQFEALSPTLAELRLEMTFDEATRTRVAGGQPGTDITGELGPPAEVVIVGCLTPAALAVGCRYLSITPAPCMDPIALLVTGEIGDPAIACLSAFVQADGTLGEIPVFQMPDEWGTEGTVYVTDLTIVPSATYDVQAACGQEGVVESVSSPASATTWLWGDANDNDYVDYDDVTLVLNGSLGNIPEGTILENLDMAPCLPDRYIDEQDITRANDAFTGADYPCLIPCPDAGDFADYLPCMAGPGYAAYSGCGRFNMDDDTDVDLADFAVFQAAFSPPP